MPADQNPRTERLIAEPISVRLGIDWTPAQVPAAGASNALSTVIASGTLIAAGAVTTAAPNNAATPSAQDVPLPPEAKRIIDALQAICALPDKTVVSWCGRPHQILKPHYANAEKGTQLIGRAGAERAAQIVLAPVDELSQHIFTKFAVVSNGKYAPGRPRFFLECEGNPTTLMTGNNVLPVTSRDPKTKKLERFPSSARNVMTTMNRVLFHFLEELTTQVTKSDAILFEPSTRQAIDGGDFDISHIQWCCYLEADVSRFLQVMVTLFATPIRARDGISSLAEQIGLRFDFEKAGRSNRVTAVMFETRHGKNSVFSVDFYNKQTRIGQMRQGETLDKKLEKPLIENNVRFDMTAHTLGIIRIIGDARRHLNAHRDYFGQLPEASLAKGFLSNKPEATARWLEFAVFILSHRMVRGRMQRVSFARYLVPLYLNEVLRLRSVVGFSLKRLQAFDEEVDHPVAKAWREAKTLDTRQWAQRLTRAAGYESDSVVYKCQGLWLKTYMIDIELPRAFYVGLRYYPPVSFSELDDAEAQLAARDQGDAAEVLRLTKDAEDVFFGQMREFVGGPVSRPPTLLPFKVIGEVVAANKEPRDELTSGNSAMPHTGLPKTPTKRRKATKSPFRKRSLAEDVGHVSNEKTLRAAIRGLYDRLAQATSTGERAKVQRMLATANKILLGYGKAKVRRQQSLKEKRFRDRFERMSGARTPVAPQKDNE